MYLSLCRVNRRRFGADFSNKLISKKCIFEFSGSIFLLLEKAFLVRLEAFLDRREMHFGGISLKMHSPENAFFGVRMHLFV